MSPRLLNVPPISSSYGEAYKLRSSSLYSPL
jgi:hypothetical protein